MNQSLLLIICAFATYQSARCLGLEKGPADIFLNIRSAICERTQSGKRTKWICDGVCCPVCLSFWFGWFFASALFVPWQAPALYAITALALGGASTALYKALG